MYNTGVKPDIGFIVSRKRGIAVERNKFKRRCRGVFRETNEFQKKKINVIVQPMGSLIGWDDIKIAFSMFLSKIYE